MTKIHIVITSPLLQADVVMPEDKALKYLKAIKKNLKEGKIQITTLEDENKSK